MRVRDLGARAADMYRLPLSVVTVDPTFNKRTDYGDMDELARQIAAVGQRVYGKVRLSDDGQSAVLIDGHRRLKAIQIANEKYGAKIETFLCMAEEKGANEESRIVDMFMFGTGKPLTLLEQAEAIKCLQGYGWDIAKIAKTLGKTAPYISQLLTLNGSSHALREAVKKNTISPTAAIKLATTPVSKQEAILDKIQATLSPDTTHTKKRTVKVKDVEKELKGIPASISSKKIRDIEKEVESLIKAGKQTPLWKAVRYGLQLAMGKVDLDPGYSV